LKLKKNYENSKEFKNSGFEKKIKIWKFEKNQNLVPRILNNYENSKEFKI
jgi:hypothetical protein